MAAAVLAGAGAFALTAPAQAEEPWGFEQVTPVEKGGAAIQLDTFTASPDGESLLYTMSTPLPIVSTESTPMYIRYIAHRGSDGWLSRGTDAPFYPFGFGSNAIQSTVGASRNLDYVVVAATVAMTPDAIDGGGNLYLRDTRTGEYTLIAAHPDRALAQSMMINSGEIAIKYVANDGSSVIFDTTRPLIPDPPSARPSNTYTWTRDGGLRIDTILPESEGGQAVNGNFAGRTSQDNGRQTVPDAGGVDHIYFSYFNDNSGARGLYLRSGGPEGTSKAISVSRIPDDDPTVRRAEGRAVTDHGRYVVFVMKTTQERLTPDTPTDLGNVRHMYLYDRVEDDLRWIGALPSTGSTSEFWQVTPDGETITFRSTIALTAEAVAGTQNIYVWRNGELRHVAVTESAPSILHWTQQLSPDGRYLAFTDDSAGLAAQFGTDTVSENCPDAPTLQTPGVPAPCSMMYRYDFEQDELICITCRPDGPEPRGHTSVSAPQLGAGRSRMMSWLPNFVTGDGTVLFTSPDDLIPADGNGLPDVYAYRDGELELVSRATAGHSARLLDATPDGETIFFATNDPIVATDTDRAFDIYVTRKGAGYPYTAPEVDPPCQGDDCRDSASGDSVDTTAAELGSRQLGGDGNFVDETKHRLGPVAVARLRNRVGPVATLRVGAPLAGRVLVRGARVRNVARRAPRAGSVVIPVRLTGRSTRALNRTGQLKVKVRVVFRARSAGQSARTLSLRFKAARRAMAHRGSKARGDR